MRSIVPIFLFIFFTNLISYSQESSFYHYFFSRNLKQLTKSEIFTDTLECFYKKGKDSSQIIFIVNKRQEKSWYSYNDTVYFFEKGKWKLTAEKYDRFYIKSSAMLFPPLINNGISYKQYLDNSNFRKQYFDTLIGNRKYNCFNETSVEKFDNLDSFSITEFFYNGLPMKHTSYALVKPLFRTFETTILQIDSDASEIEPILDDLLVFLRQNAVLFVPLQMKQDTSVADTLKIIKEFVKAMNVVNEKKILVIELWYRGCGPCRQSIPSLNALNNDKNIQVIGLNTIDSNESEVRKFMEPFAINYILSFDRNSPIQKLNTKAYPTTILFNPATGAFRFKVGYNENDHLGEIMSLINQIQ